MAVAGGKLCKCGWGRSWQAFLVLSSGSWVASNDDVRAVASFWSFYCSILSCLEFNISGATFWIRWCYMDVLVGSNHKGYWYDSSMLGAFIGSSFLSSCSTPELVVQVCFALLAVYWDTLSHPQFVLASDLRILSRVFIRWVVLLAWCWNFIIIT